LQYHDRPQDGGHSGIGQWGYLPDLTFLHISSSENNPSQQTGLPRGIENIDLEHLSDPHLPQTHETKFQERNSSPTRDPHKKAHKIACNSVQPRTASSVLQFQPRVSLSPTELLSLSPQLPNFFRKLIPQLNQRFNLLFHL
jgi:hypothetical protein